MRRQPDLVAFCLWRDGELIASHKIQENRRLHSEDNQQFPSSSLVSIEGYNDLICWNDNKHWVRKGGREWVVVYRERATRVNLLTESSDPFTTMSFVSTFSNTTFRHRASTSICKRRKKIRKNHPFQWDRYCQDNDRYVKPPTLPRRLNEIFKNTRHFSNGKIFWRNRPRRRRIT